MKILVLTNLYPPHHAGTYDFRCQTVTELLSKRGHQMRVLTSNHGLNAEQRDEEIERRLRLNGVYGHIAWTGFGDVKELEKHNHEVLRETIAEFQPNLVFVWSLYGLSKSLIFALRHAQLPTVYDVADHWLASELRQDPWLRFWNQQPAPLLNAFFRTCLELIGLRSRLDVVAPTRMMKGYDRLPSVYGAPEALEAVEPNSIAGFRFERIYFCSQALKTQTEQAGFKVSHAEVIYPGIPAEQYFGEVKPPSSPVNKFLIVSRLENESGVMTALQALIHARQNKVKSVLTICGRGDSDYVAQLKSFALRNQLPAEFITVSNLTRDLPGIYRQHDAFLYTAEWDEPYAAPPLEAMACGLPLIGAKSGGVRELLRHGENAFTYTPGDALELASRIQELQMQRALRAQMAETAQAEALGKFNESTVTDQIENYLETSLEVWQQT